MSQADREWPFTRTSFLMCAALLIWLATFTCAYVLAALGCALTFDDARLFGFRLVPLATTIMIAAAAFVTIVLVRSSMAKRDDRPLARFIRFVCVATGTLALMSLLLLWLPPLFLRQAVCI